MKNFISTPDDLVAEAVVVLYLTDPALTYCNSNGIVDEYISEAKLIAEGFAQQDQPLWDTMVSVFDSQFDGHFDTDRLVRAYKTLNKKLC